MLKWKFFSVSLVLALVALSFLFYREVQEKVRRVYQLKEAPLSLDSWKIDPEAQVVLLGDSHAFFWGIREINKLKVQNLGIGGHTSAQCLARLELNLKDAYFDLAIVLIGANDIKAIGVLSEREDRIVKRSMDHIQSILAKLNQNVGQIILCTIPPQFESSWKNYFLDEAAMKRAREKINQEIFHMKTQKVKVLDIDHLFSKRNEKLSVDGLHMNIHAYSLLEEEVIRLLKNE